VRLSRTVLICLPTVAQRAHKVLVHDGLGIWLAARRLHQGKLFWLGSRHGAHVESGAEQLNALVLGLPWQRVGPGDAISIVWRQPWPRNIGEVFWLAVFLPLVTLLPFSKRRKRRWTFSTIETHGST